MAIECLSINQLSVIGVKWSLSVLPGEYFPGKSQAQKENLNNNKIFVLFHLIILYTF